MNLIVRTPTIDCQGMNCKNQVVDLIVTSVVLSLRRNAIVVLPHHYRASIHRLLAAPMSSLLLYRLATYASLAKARELRNTPALEFSAQNGNPVSCSLYPSLS